MTTTTLELSIPLRTAGDPVISNRQVDYLRDLLKEYRNLVTDPVAIETIDYVADKLWTLRRRQASTMIDTLKSTIAGLRRAARAAQPGEDPTELVSGIYRLKSGTIFKVYRGQSGRMLSKQLIVEGDKAFFEYAGLATRFVKDAMRMTLEDAKEFGAIYGVCCNCGRTLTNETSIEEGIGPVCAGRI